jgi:hypothetical protein
MIKKNKKTTQKIKPMTLVKFDPIEGTHGLMIAMYGAYLMTSWYKVISFFVFLGELTNMPAHCVLAGHNSGRIYVGYLTNNFVKI